jgi:ribosomal protein L37E
MRQWRKKDIEKDPEAWRAHNEERRTWAKKNPAAALGSDRRCKKKAVDEKRHYCAICDHAFTKKAKLTKHLSGPKHAAKAAQAARSGQSSS